MKQKKLNKTLVPLAGIMPYLKEPLQNAIKKHCPDFNDAVLIRSQHEMVGTFPLLELQKSAGPQGDATIYVSTRNLDRDGDVVLPSGWEVKMYSENPVGLWSHRNDMPPIFKALETKADGYGLRQIIQFADTEAAQDAKRLFMGGFLKTFSAGFRALESLYRRDQEDEEEFNSMMQDCSENWPEFKETAGKVERFITKQVLFESSLCNIPANPFAMVQQIHGKKLEISEWMRKELKVEEYIKKAMDEGKLEPKAVIVKPEAKPETPPAPPAEIKAVTVCEIKEYKRIVEYKPDPIPGLIQEALKKSIAKIRGAV